MAKELNTRCRICGGPVTPGCEYCSHFCKLTARNDKALKKAKATTKKGKE